MLENKFADADYREKLEPGKVKEMMENLLHMDGWLYLEAILDEHVRVREIILDTPMENLLVDFPKQEYTKGERTMAKWIRRFPHATMQMQQEWLAAMNDRAETETEDE